MFGEGGVVYTYTVAKNIYIFVYYVYVGMFMNMKLYKLPTKYV